MTTKANIEVEQSQNYVNITNCGLFVFQQLFITTHGQKHTRMPKF
jgi:hypothetical protein